MECAILKVGNVIALYNASAASDVKLFRSFLIVFTLLAIFFHVLSKCARQVST